MNDDRLTTRQHAFTLIELLVVVSIIALLIGILLPSLSRARGQAYQAVCGSNVSQLVKANMMYSQSESGRYCPGAARFRENYHRWHGARASTHEPFDPDQGPLNPYLGYVKGVRACPVFNDFSENGFEKGNGGYGYNQAYIGSILKDVGYGFYTVETDETGIIAERVRKPMETLMFADTAIAYTDDAPSEYSFAEPRFHPTRLTRRPDPSIHFRHGSKSTPMASIAWTDGHVDWREQTFSWNSGIYPADPKRFNLGWFGKSDDNSLFDLE